MPAPDLNPGPAGTGPLTRRLPVAAPALHGSSGGAAQRPGASGGDTRSGGSVRVIHHFEDSQGSYPDTDLARDSAGNLYGMTVKGGTSNSGTVFELSPSGAGWAYAVLYNFKGGADGGEPYGGVTLDAMGNLYGTTVAGGTGAACDGGCGVVFALTKSGGTWTESVIHNFAGGNDGSGPGSPVTFDSLGNLYGMTPTGGAFGVGTIFQLMPHTDGTWTESVIHAFTGGDDGGAASAGRLLIDAKQNVFGVATVGGANGAGVVFRMTPSPTGNWRFTTLYTFKGQPDGVFPYGGLVKDTAGNFYGTTYYGGTDDLGVVYRLSPSGGQWSETVLHSFAGGFDGASSISGLTFGPDGALYGTTSAGGASCDCGTIFKMTPVDGSWTERVVYRFTGTPDGSSPYAGVTTDPAGNLYGATVRGGMNDDGIVYLFRP
jgi:uncharacterized repeat protein (TIGR03803 family)